MKKAALIFFFFALGLSVQAQAYRGMVRGTVNFRAKANTSSEKLGSLKKGTKLFLYSKEKVGDYYHVLVVETGVEGYIYSSYVQVGKVVPENKDGIFKQVGKTLSSKTSIRVNNKSEHPVTLKLNDEVYTFTPDEKKVLSLPAGTYNFVVQAKGQLPDYGAQTIEKGYEYIWSYSIE